MSLQSFSTAAIDERVADLLGRMTLAEKIGQMTQAEKNSITPRQVSEFAIGSVLSGGGGNPTPNNPQAWANMVRPFVEASLQTRLAIPLLYGVDAVHGHSNVYGATIFPHNVGLGAARDPGLVERVMEATAREMAATHVRWTFAPALSVPQDLRWGRTYEGFGSDPDLVAALGAAAVRGLQSPAFGQGHGVLACAKHFVGDGGTEWGSTPRYDWIEGLWQSEDDRWSIDQGSTMGDEQMLRAVHLRPYLAAMAAGARNIMVSYSSWRGHKMHTQKYLLTDVLKGEMGFDGFLVSDWLAVDQIDPDYYTAVVTAINAGLDMVMVPFVFERFIEALTRAVRQGDVAEARIDDAARRILSTKMAMNLFDHPLGDERLLPAVGGEEHRAVAREAVRKSAVLLKNEGVLPLPAGEGRLLVAGRAADDIGLQCGGWTIEWQGEAGPITPGTTLLEGIQARVGPGATVQYRPDGDFDPGELADVAIVVLAEAPYAEGEGDRADLSLPAADVELLARVRPLCRKLLIILYSGRPLLVADQLPQWDGFVAAWLPGSEGASLAGLLFGDQPFAGRLPYRWPRHAGQIGTGNGEQETPLFPRSFGL